MAHVQNLYELYLYPVRPEPFAYTQDRLRGSGGEGRTTLSRDLAASLKDLGEKVLPSIGQRVVVAEAALSGLTVREYAPGSLAQQEFHALAQALERLLRP